jgi:hypothetical protein
MPLEGVPADEWVVFDRALIVRDLFTGGTRTFTNSADARAFRAEVYRQYGEQRDRQCKVQLCQILCEQAGSTMGVTSQCEQYLKELRKDRAGTGSTVSRQAVQWGHICNCEQASSI